MSTPRFEVIPSRRWSGPNGRTASLYGALPYTSDSESHLWKVEDVGYTVRDNVNGTVGVGRPPEKTEEAAQTLADKLNALYTRTR